MADNKTLVFSDENNNKIELATKLSVAERFAVIDKKIGNGLVPEESGTVSLGSEDKKYKEIYANKIIVDEIVGSDGKPINTGTYILNVFGYLKRNTTYSTNDILAIQKSSSEVVYVECIQKGTTGTNNINVDNCKIGDTITDGTSAWKVIAFYNDESKKEVEYIATTSGPNSALDSCSGTITCYNDENNTIAIRWADPANDNDVKWIGSIITKKYGSYPTKPDDGTVVITTTVKNRYRDEAYIESQENIKNWYYRGFAIYSEGTYSSNVNGYFEKVSADKNFHYAIYIDENDPIESTCVHTIKNYNNTNYEPIKMLFASTSDRCVLDWGDWEHSPIMPKPCMLKNDGTVAYYLNKLDYSKKIDGTASDISNPNYAGNAMMEWPKIFIKVERIDSKLYLYFCNIKYDENYECYPCLKADGSYADHFYTAIYEGSIINDKLRSLSGQTVTTTVIHDFLNSASSIGNGFNMSTWADTDLIRCLGILVTGRLNSQLAIGYGKTLTNGTYTTGAGNSKGMFWGGNNSAAINEGTKFFGMENFWGSLPRSIIGLSTDASNNVMVKNTYHTADRSTSNSYSVENTGYKNIGKIANSSLSGFTSKINGTKDAITVPIVATGSSTTYFSDKGNIAVNGIAYVGAKSSPESGLFNIVIGNRVISSSSLSYHAYINTVTIPTTYNASELNIKLGSYKNLGIINNIQGARKFISDHIYNGKFYNINVGDKVTINDGTYNKEWYVAGFDTELNVDHTLGSYGRHHIALVPVDMLLNAQMNSSNANSSGYNGSLMKTSTIKTIDTTLQKVLGDTLLPHKETLSTGSSSGVAQVEVYSIIMNEKQVFGSKNCDNYNGTADGDDNIQLPLFKLRAETKKIASNSYWWLRCPCSSLTFALVNSGSPNSNYASHSYGVRPLILLG